MSHAIIVERLIHSKGRHYNMALRDASRDALIDARDRTAVWSDCAQRHRSLAAAVERFDRTGSGKRGQK